MSDVHLSAYLPTAGTMRICSKKVRHCFRPTAPRHTLAGLPPLHATPSRSQRALTENLPCIAIGRGQLSATILGGGVEQPRCFLSSIVHHTPDVKRFCTPWTNRSPHLHTPSSQSTAPNAHTPQLRGRRLTLLPVSAALPSRARTPPHLVDD